MDLVNEPRCHLSPQVTGAFVIADFRQPTAPRAAMRLDKTTAQAA